MPATRLLALLGAWTVLVAGPCPAAAAPAGQAAETEVEQERTEPDRGGALEPEPGEQAGSAAAGEPATLREAIARLAAEVQQAMGPRAPLALLPPEALGTRRDLGRLVAELPAALEAAGVAERIPPATVAERGGQPPAPTAAGLAAAARRAQAAAALLVRWIEAAEQVELHALLVAADGRVLLDRSYPLAVAAQPPQPPAAGRPGPPPGAEAREIFLLRRLVLADDPRRRDRPRALRRGQPLGELELAELSGQPDLLERVQQRVAAVRSRRRLGMGLTLAGIAVAGLSTPLYNAGDDARIAGGVVTGLGLAAGVTGAVLWGLVAEQAQRVGGPDPVHPVLTPAEIESAVRSFNAGLRRELGLPPAGDPVSVRWLLGPTPGGGAGAGVLLRF